MQRLGVDLGGLRIRLTDDGSVFTEIAPSSHASDVLLAPPLVDIQLNGFGGIDINSPDVQPDDLLNMLEKVWAGGVGFFLPTVVTGSRERMLRSIRMVREACRQDARFARSVVGIHVEGPYISLEDGPRGAHPLQHVRQPDMDEYRAWQEAADGTVRLVTLSPEWDNAPPFIEHIVNDDVRIAIGHTKATSEQLDAAVRAGATLSTHLGNGAHAMIQRHPNYIWEQLGDDRLWASLIADTHHLPPRTLKSMVRGKTLDRTIFTSDAVWVAGLPAGQYGGFDGKGLEVLETGRVNLAGTPYLAGAGLPLADGVENGVRHVGLTLAESWRVASVNPAEYFGIEPLVGWRVGGDANLVRATWDAETASLTILETVVSGETVYSA